MHLRAAPHGPLHQPANSPGRQKIGHHNAYFARGPQVALQCALYRVAPAARTAQQQLFVGREERFPGAELPEVNEAFVQEIRPGEHLVECRRELAGQRSLDSEPEIAPTAINPVSFIFGGDGHAPP